MTTVSSCIEVAIALPVYSTYVYSVPENLSALVSTGKRVLVPFGRRRVTGYILGACKKTDQGKTINILDILDILDEEPLFPSSMINFSDGRLITTCIPSEMLSNVRCPADLMFMILLPLPSPKREKKPFPGIYLHLWKGKS